MSSFFGNTFVQAILVFLAVIGGYVVFQTIGYYSDTPTDTNQMPMENMPRMEATDVATEPEAETGPMHYRAGMDLSGIHIMGNGDVMTGGGVVITDATIRPDGMIEFPDGTTVEPMMDMRQ